MASFFKKALGVFVEFDDEQQKDTSTPAIQLPNITTPEVSRNPENHAEAEKFEKYFDNLFEKANLPGPDYFEFYKTMEMLEAHIPDEKARLSATFASLAIQGLTKQTLLETAARYKTVIEQDHVNFEKALNDKLKSEVGDRQQQLLNLEKKIAANSEQIQRLTKEISDAQVQMGQIKTQVLEQENKLTKNKNGYQVACQAVLNKITTDIQKIQATL
ncbi:MAG: hypothetical protein JWO09_3431 [Bacteroidetes bacterium]|nr:hypothetical protein [Bacteroidota bacterium]